MSTIAMTAHTFPIHIQNGGILFVDFWASWCGPCRAFAPIYEAASKKHPDVTWAKVDTDVEQDLAAALEIRAIPTLMVFRDGVQLFARPGLLPPAALDKLVEMVRALDMNDLRRKIVRPEVA